MASPGRRPRERPRPSTARTSSASSPSPAAKRNRRSTVRLAVERPSIRPSVIVRSPGSARTRAASTGLRGSPSARESTLVPPPGMNPTRTSPSIPFTTSLKPPSPEKT